MRMASSIRVGLGVLLSLVVVLVGAQAVWAFDVPASAFDEGAIHDGDAHIESRLVVDAEAVAPGETVRVGVAFDLDTDWHIYWQNPGEAGVPTDIKWESDDLEFGPLEWATPSTFGDPGGELTSYGYSDEVVLFSEATIAKDAVGSVEVRASVDYRACHNLCLPGHSQLSRTIPVAAKTSPAEASVLSAIDASQAKVPRRAADVGIETRFHYSQQPLRPGDRFEAVVELIECEAPGEGCRDFQVVYETLEHAFLPDKFSAPKLAVTGISEHPEAASGVVIRLRGQMPAAFEFSKRLVSGVVRLEQSDGKIVGVHLRDEIDTAEQGAAVENVALPAWAELGGDDAPALASGDSAGDAEESTSLGWMLLMAFLGGMILNLMPCVFPVLALKVSAFTKLVHESRRSVVAHGAAYTGGIVGSMLVLAGAVIGLRMAGTQVGWGFQFQQPHFLAALVIILVLFALNLFGVFEVTLNSQSLHEKTEEASGVRRSFWEGILAVVLATPCSAPFLGTAVGFALASSGLTIVAVFAALGLGLAAPMVVLTLVPGWAKVLPRPGDWMVHLKKFLGFALLGSAIWIVWLLGRQTGVDGMARMLVFSGVIALAAWLFGLVQFRSMGKKKLAALVLAAGAIGSGAGWAFPLQAAPDDLASLESSGMIDWRPWSEHAVQQALEEGRPVFVDFTADWCLTCKVNEKNAIDTEPVRRAIADHGVVTFKADWTNPDERIRKKLAEFGRAGVPFYLVYSPDEAGEPTALPDVITSTMLVDAFEEAAGDS